MTFGSVFTFFDFHALFLGTSSCSFVAVPFVVIDTSILLDCFNHRQPFPRFAQCDFNALIQNMVTAANGLCQCPVHIFDQIHHTLIIGICLIHFNGCKFRIVGWIHALVPEDSADFINPFKSANNQLFQVQFGFNPQEHIHIQCIVMGHKRSCRSGNLQRQQNRCFYFYIANIVQIISDFPQNLASDHKGVLHLWIDNQIQIPLPVTGILILQTVPLFRQLQQCLGKQGNFLCMNGNFALLRTEYKALDTDNITDVPLLKFLECFLTADVVHPNIDLNSVRAVPYINEVCTSHISPAHDSAGDGNDLFLERF